MKWAAIETEDGEARVIDTDTNRVVARIISEPFEGMRIANLIAAAPDTLHLLASYKKLASDVEMVASSVQNLRQQINASKEGKQ